MGDLKKTDIFKRKDQLCWDCAKACGGCEWSDGLDPVPGWTAKKVLRKDGWHSYTTYEITACPKFERDKRK